MPRATFLHSFFLVTAVLLFCSCGGSPAPDSSDTQSTGGAMPEITDDLIRERINRAWLRKVPAENGTDEPITWSFGQDEPKEITVVEKQVNDTTATLVLDIKTGTRPRAREPKSLAGQIRTKWELRKGWVLRQWEIVDTENISMTYKKLPKPPPENSNR